MPQHRFIKLGIGPVALAFAVVSSKWDYAVMDELIAAHGMSEFANGWLQVKSLDWPLGDDDQSGCWWGRGCD